MKFCNTLHFDVSLSWRVSLFHVNLKKSKWEIEQRWKFLPLVCWDSSANGENSAVLPFSSHFSYATFSQVSNH